MDNMIKSSIYLSYELLVSIYKGQIKTCLNILKIECPCTIKTYKKNYDKYKDLKMSIKLNKRFKEELEKGIKEFFITVLNERKTKYYMWEYYRCCNVNTTEIRNTISLSSETKELILETIEYRKNLLVNKFIQEVENNG